MTDANPDQPTSSKEEPTGASPDQPKQEPGNARSRRSNEFWLALAGIAATVAVGITGSWLAHQTSTDQLKAESGRAALSFSREQRKIAYAEFLNAAFDLDRAEFNIKNPESTSFTGPLDFRGVPLEPGKQLETLFNVYTDATDRFNRASSTVRLLASHDVVEARDAIKQQHSVLFFDIANLMSIARTGASPDTLEVIRSKMDLHTGSGVEQHFIDAAKKDLGLAD
jgi:hypothetical protein